MTRLLKIRQVLDRIPVSRAQIYNLIAEGKFPKQVKLGGTGAFWVEQEVEEWLAAQIAACRSNPGAAVESEAA